MARPPGEHDKGDNTEPFARSLLPTTLDPRETESKVKVANPATEPVMRAASPSIEVDVSELESTGERAATVPPHAPTQGVEEIRQHFARGEFETALAIAEAVLAYDGGNEEARSFATSAAIRLRTIYLAKLGSVARVPKRPSDATVGELGLDTRSTAVLGRVDGKKTIADIVRGGETSEIEALRVLVQLVERGLVRLGLFAQFPQNWRFCLPPPVERHVKLALATVWQKTVGSVVVAPAEPPAPAAPAVPPSSTPPSVAGAGAGTG